MWHVLLNDEALSQQLADLHLSSLRKGLVNPKDDPAAASSGNRTASDSQACNDVSKRIDSLSLNGSADSPSAPSTSLSLSDAKEEPAGTPTPTEAAATAPPSTATSGVGDGSGSSAPATTPSSPQPANGHAFAPMHHVPDFGPCVGGLPAVSLVPERTPAKPSAGGGSTRNDASNGGATAPAPPLSTLLASSTRDSGSQDLDPFGLSDLLPDHLVGSTGSLMSSNAFFGFITANLNFPHSVRQNVQLKFCCALQFCWYLCCTSVISA